ncbi:hypothetical protein MLD38_006419 [Melastoma candidum]|uniref:Uncharacterized protein n=1 Tax=Melastoma candidum TaxID=119954 RepID=A0ACB9RMT2_9MYRT|nr:hypothetical protein MLD38_006419 [Melastoma candidum]
MSMSKGSRVNLADLKGQMVKRIGPERSKEYFYYLTRFLSQKLNKVEYEKLCRRLLGRENLPLHNQLMRSILNNVMHGKGPPVFQNGTTASILHNKNSLVSTEDGKEQRFVALSNQHADSSVWSNGILPHSPWKIRSGIKDRKSKDRPSPLGPNGKVVAFEETGNKLIKENGILTLCDYERHLLHLPTVAERPEEDKDDSSLRVSDILKMLEKDDEAGLAVLKEGADVKQGKVNPDSKSPLSAPLGIPNCFASVGGGHKCLPVGGLGSILSCYECGQLSDSKSLRQYMNQIAEAQGLAGVSEESANILNSALDVYLKRLIRSCIELVGSRSSGHSYRDRLLKLQMSGRIKNGVAPLQNHLHVGISDHNFGGPLLQISSTRISFHDFRVAMELNPHQLGEDWSLLLEKVSLHPFER